ncbi:MAG: HD domain-containing protein [Candidatus Babeliales bacterium]|nr:HD domain-containing protein [Candidatus Babeliales bacterium]
MTYSFPSIFSQKLSCSVITGSVIKTIYGDFEIQEQVLIDLLNSAAVQRLKKIRQGGMTDYVFKEIDYSRYDHSVGVLVILMKFKASLNERIAGLLHDVSHTAFSHVADVVFNHRDEKESYQDAIHEWYIQNTDIPEILKRYNISVKEILHKTNDFKALEQDLPDLCADRLEYNLHTAYLNGMLTQEDISAILSDLTFFDGKWFFNSIEIATQFASVPLKLNQSYWALEVNLYVYYFAGKLLRRALELNIITHDDFHFKDDYFILEKLDESSDTEIQDLMSKIFNFQDHYKLGSFSDSDLFLKGKFRGINPLIKCDSEFKRLCDVNNEFKIEFANVKAKLSQGFFFKFL